MSKLPLHFTLDPHAGKWLIHGLDFLHMQKTEQAQACFINALYENEKNTDAWIYIGIIFGINKDEKAIRCFEAALLYNPNANEVKKRFKEIFSKTESAFGDNLKDIKNLFKEAELKVNNKTADEPIQIKNLPITVHTGYTIPQKKPHLDLTLSLPPLIFNEWNRVNIPLYNKGTAEARKISLVFEKDFEIRGNGVLTVGHGMSATLELELLPKVKGVFSVDVTLSYEDKNGKKFNEKHLSSLTIGTRSEGFNTPHFPDPGFHPNIQLDNPEYLLKMFPDKYIESSFLGRGGFAHVFKVKRKNGQILALKTPLMYDEDSGRNFIHEIQNWELLLHKNIVKIFDYNITPIPYIEMELCDCTLSEWKKTQPNKNISPESTAWIMFSVCDGLKYAHSHKIIHRDLKPQNILLKNTIPKISDWGLAKPISQNSSKTPTSFTPYYAAPEQINNQLKDERTDIWQLGVIMYELTCDALPFSSDTPFQLYMDISTKTPVSPKDINPGLKDFEHIILTSIEKSPERRYQSVKDLQKALATYLKLTYHDKCDPIKSYGMSVTYLGDLLIISMRAGELRDVLKYLYDLDNFVEGTLKKDIKDLRYAISHRIDNGLTEVPDQIIQQTELIMQKLKFRKKP